MLPWVHVHALPNSNVLPCCVWPYDKPLGNLKATALKEIWNNEAYSEVRRKMLNDEPVEECHQCYERELSGTSLRTESNIECGSHFDRLVTPSIPDGKLKDFHMAFFDIRFSNICNFKCRGCSPELSSSWLSDYEELHQHKTGKEKLISILPNWRAWSELMEHLPQVERAYFAGGEPLIMDEHYLVLEELIRLERFNVTLSYNTNMSNLRFRDKFVQEYWNKFSRVMVSVSIDDFGGRGEYFRSGMNWKRTVENILAIKKSCPHVVFSINCTVSLFNVYYLPELHMESVRLNLIRAGDFFANILIDPAEYRVQNLPKEFREKAIKKLSNYVEKMRIVYGLENPFDFNKLSRAFLSTIRLLGQDDDRSSVKDFLEMTQKLDSIRKENFFEVYPELAFLKDHLDPSEDLK